MTIEQWISVCNVAGAAAIGVACLGLFLIVVPWIWCHGLFQFLELMLWGWKRWRVTKECIWHAARGCECCEAELLEAMKDLKKSRDGK